MAYEIPVQTFDAIEHAKNKALRANQLQEMILTQFKESYHDFWGVSNPPTGSRYTTEEMQAIIDVMPATVVDILTDAAQFYSYISSAYPEVIEVKYASAAYNYTVGPGGLVLSSLKEDWVAPVVPSEESV
jgi:hypothetical protein